VFPKVKLIADGTYFYVQKSENFSQQKMSFSSHKHANLLKELMFVTPDGVFVESFGPFYSKGNHNDQALYNYVVSENLGGFTDGFVSNDDEVIVNRGFR
jgi:hypothetical protein